MYAKIDIEAKVAVGENLLVSDCKDYAIQETCGTVNLYCIIEAVDDDKVVTLRIGGSIFLIDPQGHAPDPGTPCLLAVSSKCLTLYNIGLT